MANEFKLSYTAADINTRLGRIDSLAEKSELREYVTETELNAKGYLTEHQSLEGLATQKYVEESLAQKQPIGDYALKSDIPTGGSAIIDVIELPTEDIRQDCFYRLMSAKFVQFGEEVQDGSVCYCVNTLPEVGETVTNFDMSFFIAYYSITDNDVYGYADATLAGAFNVPAGWYTFGALAEIASTGFNGIVTDINDLPDNNNAYGVLLSKDFYIYQDGWCKIPFACEKEPEFDIQWDGEIGDRVALDMSQLGYDQGVYFVKVSDDVFTTDEMIGWTYNIRHSDGLTLYEEVNEYDFDVMTYPGAFIINDWIVVMHSQDELAAALGLPTGFLTNGVYFLINEVAYISRLVAPPKVVKIDEKYLPDIDAGVGKNVSGQYFYGNGGSMGIADEGAEIFNDYDTNIAVGKCSHAEGKGTTASGDYSHAEGNGTTAYGDWSHAEGGATTASGERSHAEGGTTTASGNSSHAEGIVTTASGTCSHAEGYGTTAYGTCSHAEGYGTTAYGKCSHVQGIFNSVDNHYIDGYRTKYAHIVGNGTSNTALSNAHTLDWDGNAWFRGDVYVGGTGQDDENAVKLATMNDVNVFVAKVYETTYAEVLEAYNSGKACFAIQQYFVHWLTKIDENCAEFVGVYFAGNRVCGTRSLTVYPYKIHGQEWTVSVCVDDLVFADRRYVDDAIASLTNSAPEALNTLDELAAALGDDENFATTVTNQIASKQDAITGTAGQFVVIGEDGKPTTKTILIAEEATF